METVGKTYDAHWPEVKKILRFQLSFYAAPLAKTGTVRIKTWCVVGPHPHDLYLAHFGARPLSNDDPLQCMTRLGLPVTRK